MKGLVDPERSQNSQFESHCLKGSHNEEGKKPRSQTMTNVSEKSESLESLYLLMKTAIV